MGDSPVGVKPSRAMRTTTADTAVMMDMARTTTAKVIRSSKTSSEALS